MRKLKYNNISIREYLDHFWTIQRMKNAERNIGDYEIHRYDLNTEERKENEYNTINIWSNTVQYFFMWRQRHQTTDTNARSSTNLKQGTHIK